MNLLENLVNNVFWIWSIRKFCIFCCILAQISYWEKSGSWDMGKNVLGQLDCRIFKSTVSLEQNNERAYFFACWYIFMEIKSSLENIEVGMVKNRCGQSGHRTLNLALSQEGINGINWFLVCWWNFRKVESYFNNFRCGVQKWAWPFRSCWVSKICYILRMNEWNELILRMLIQI